MPAISTGDAIDQLVRAVESMDADNLLDFYNEVFPAERKTELDSSDAGVADREKILRYLRRDLGVEETLEFWNVAFPSSYNVHFDDDEQTVHYSILTEATRIYE